MNALKAAYSQRGLKPREAARLLGISKRYLAYLEAGQRGPGRALERKIEQEFGVKREEILKEDQP